MDNRQLIGLEVGEAERILNDNGITNFEFLVFTDRKQCHSDKEIIARVTEQGGKYTLIVCPLQTAVRTN